ncbi:MAG TPA: flavodoxin domain-containing protein [Acidimicrobiales bacterium]|nr:flavodoxin domain-containing protein [Acidimicrobiales bacterium]
MRALVTYGSKMGGTAGLAGMVGEALRRHGVVVDVVAAREAGRPGGYDAVIVGGALYGGRWHRDARRYVTRHRRELRDLPVWLFSSGPLGDDGQKPDIPPVGQVAALARRIGARGHRTFGGCLRDDAPGFIARSMARTLAGDWRDPDDVERWASLIVGELASTHTAP